MTKPSTLLAVLAASAFAIPAPLRAQSPSLDELLQSAPAAIPDSAPPAMASIDRAQLARHAYFLASDALGGRHTGTAGQRAAAAYIAERFRAAGLEPLGDVIPGEDGRRYLQEYEVARTAVDPDRTFLELDGERIERGFGIARGRTDEAESTGRLVFCGRGRRNEVPDELAEGDLPVVFLSGEPPQPGMPPEVQFMMGFREMAKVGGLARKLHERGAETLLVLDWQNRLGDVLQYAGVLPGKPDLSYGNEIGMGTMLASNRPDVPVFVVGRPLAQRVLDMLGVAVGEDGKPIASETREVAARASVRIEKTGGFRCSNVAAVLRGSDPALASEAVVFSAHMDHMGTRLDGDVFNGADDNASGSSALLEIAEAFATGEPPRRSVIFLSVSGEELGLWGSEHFAANPPWKTEDLVANVNIDMIGRSTELSNENQISITPSYRHPKFSSIARDSAALAEALGMTFTNGDTYYERSDHYNFAKRGIPVVFFCDGEHPDYHQVTDTADKLDYVKMERVARLAFWTGWQVAMADARPVELGRQRDWTASDDDDAGDAGR